MKLLLKGATVVDPSQDLEEQADLLIEDGCITAIGTGIQADYARELDLTGKFLVPGFVDMHVHLREPGFEGKETIATGTASAVAGGITSLACMPNTAPPIDNPMIVGYIQQKAREAGLARVYPVGALTRNRQGEFMADYSALYEAGVRAFSDDGDPIENSYLLYQIFKYLLVFEDTLIISHCEDRRLAADGLVHEGYWSNLLGLPGIPPVAETMAVAREVLLAQATGKRLHLAHISTAGAVEWIRWAKEKGLPVTAEVTPHHLLLTEAAVEGYNTAAKVNPPLRSEEDRQALLQGLREGVIDVIATDHAPHKIDEKDLDYFEAPFGIIGLETAVPTLLTELVQRGKLSLRELVQAYSCRPARILGVTGGTLQRGTPADITVLDLEAEGVIEPRHFYSKARNTPFAGREVRGLPILTLVGGEIKMEKGAVKVGSQE